MLPPLQSGGGFRSLTQKPPFGAGFVCVPCDLFFSSLSPFAFVNGKWGGVWLLGGDSGSCLIPACLCHTSRVFLLLARPPTHRRIFSFSFSPGMVELETQLLAVSLWERVCLLSLIPRTLRVSVVLLIFSFDRRWPAGSHSFFSSPSVALVWDPPTDLVPIPPKEDHEGLENSPFYFFPGV